MASPGFIRLSGDVLNRTVLDDLKDPASKVFITNTLTAALKAKLSAAAASINQQVLQQLVQGMTPADIGANKDLSLRAFVTKSVKLPTDPAAKQAAQTAIAQLSDTTTVGDLLGLDMPVNQNPLFESDVAKVNLATLLGTSPALANPQLQDTFISRYVSFQGAIQDFWKQLSQDAQFKAVVPELQFTLQLGALSLNNPALVTAIRSQYKPSSLRDLTKLDTPTLGQLITTRKIPVPADFPGATPAEKATNYSDAIISLLKSAYPTDYVARGLSSSTDPINKGVATFLANSQDFDFRTTDVDSYIKRNSANAFRNVASAQISAVTNQLKAIQRVFRINPEYSVINVLIGAGLDSAHKIASIPHNTFVQQYAPKFGGTDQAEMVYTSAQHVSAMTSNLFLRIRQAVDDHNPRVIGNSSDALAKSLGQTIPNWQTLFGSTSFCQCEQCRSVYGAAAYLVDLLEFLRKSGTNGSGFSPLDVLAGRPDKNLPGRRPDLRYIKLNCQNTNTTLPYVDLVNEILESYVALNGKLDATTAKNTPTDATADELSLNPEYTIDTAYATLSAAYYPLNLPFNRPVEIARSYLEFLGSGRYAVMKDFGTQSPQQDRQAILAAEYLKMNEQEYTFITGRSFVMGAPVPAEVTRTLYGYAADNETRTNPDGSTTTKAWNDWLAGVPEFLQRTETQYSDLVSLLNTQYLNPARSITLKATGGDPCDLSKTIISPLDEPTAKSFYPFLRLWKRLGWQISDLDGALSALAPAGIDRGFVLVAAQLNQLQSSLNLPLNQLLTLWSNINTDWRDSLYVSLFQNKSVVNPVDSAFQLAYLAPLAALPAAPFPASVNTQISYDSAKHLLRFVGAMTDDQRRDLLMWAGSDASTITAIQNLYQMRWFKGTELAQTAEPLSAHVNTILAALRISASDLDAIRAAVGLADSGGSSVPLNLANLSSLYRYAILAKALGVSVPDLISLISLTGIHPFTLATTDPVAERAVKFVDMARAVLASRFSVSQLNYIYRAISDPASGLRPLEADVDLLVVNLQTGLEKIAASTTFVPDPTGAVLRQKLAVVLGNSLVAPTMNLINGSAVYIASLASLPVGLNFPATLSGQISYDSVGQVLRFVGPMTDSVLGQLKLLSNDPNYLKALNSLWQQPRDILSANLSLLDQTQAAANLINASLPNVADRYNFVLAGLLTYLQGSQSRNLIKQTLSQALGLDPALMALLLSGAPTSTSPSLLKSQTDSTQPAIADFLAVRDGGLLAEYFSDLNLSAGNKTQIDGSVDIGPGGPIPAQPFSVRWTGKAMPQSSEPYTFYVNANDGVRLWVDEQLLIDQWSNQGVNERSSPSVSLNAGQLYDIELEYYSTLNAAVAQLSWSSPSTPKALIPRSSLLPASPFATLFLLYRIALLVNTFSLKVDEIAYLSAHSADFAGVDPNDSTNAVPFDLSLLPVDRSNPTETDKKAVAFFNQWQRLNDLLGLRNRLPSSNASLFDVFRAAAASSNPAKLSTNIANAVLAATGWNANEFATLIGNQVDSMTGTTIGFNLADADFKNEMGRNGIGLVWLSECLALSARLGVSTRQLFGWANNAPDAMQARDIKNTVKAKYDDAAWVMVGKPLNDKLREKSKVALISYILTMQPIVQRSITNSNELYEYFLIDVDMSACMLTSRIVQANAAIQLFVQRCLMNLENSNADKRFNISPDAIDAMQWEWRKNYRVWEANREVFLYPENWAEPSLRDNKTSFFIELERELQQKEITSESAEEAYRNYLEKLEEVSRLEIAGLFCEVDTDTKKDVLHVFGRSFSSPHVYYYRRLDNTTHVWSPWEKVDVEIEGDHLIPVVWNRRLFIFWPTFKETVDPNEQQSSSGMQVPTAGQSNYQPPSAKKDLEIKLGWSEYKQSKWAKKQVTAQSLTPIFFTPFFKGYSSTLQPSAFAFKAGTNNGSLVVSVWLPITLRSSRKAAWCVGMFTFGGCKSDGQPSVPGIFTLPYLLPGVGDNMDVDVKTGSLTLQIIDLSSANGAESLPVLGTAPDFVQMVFPQQTFADDRLSSSSPPFFYQDDRRTYFATETVLNNRWLQDPNYIIPIYDRAQLTSNESAISLPGPPVLDSKAVVPGSIAETRFAPARTTVMEMEVLHTAGATMGALSRGAVGLAGGSSGVVAIPSTSAFSAAMPLAGERIGRLYAPVDEWKNWGGHYYYTGTGVQFSTHFHSHVCDFIQALNRKGIPGLLTLANEQLISADTPTKTAFEQNYQPTQAVALPYPTEAVDFSPFGAYSIYNWELFFHIPLLIATRLSQNQRFEDAQKWFHFIFNPTTSSTDPIPSRYWNFLPFYQDTESGRIEELLASLDYVGSDPTKLAEKAEMKSEILQWVNSPFNPHLIARMRVIAYQKNVVMKYIDNLIAWADFLYSQYTRESVYEAAQLYVLAQEILGDQPVQIPPQGTVQDETYNDLINLPNGLDDFSNALVQLENQFPFSGADVVSGSNDSGSSSQTSLMSVPYFCTPPNDILLGYWGTVADRLFKIRLCLNIKGVAQRLPLFAPPISPALLLQAGTMGVDLTSALSDINAATPYYRFMHMLQKALELCGEVRALGGGLLSALERKDGEHLALLRASQETSLLKAARQVKQRQLDEANATLAGLQNSRVVTDFRRTWYQGLISAGLSAFELEQVSALVQAKNYQQNSQVAELFGSYLATTPEFNFGASGFGGSPITSVSFGGSQLSAAAGAVGRVFSMMAATCSHEANMASLMGGWDRRAQDWSLQAQLAALELAQIDKQILAAQIRAAIAQNELDNHDLQISNASDVEDFLRTKYTNEDLYDWMVSRISAVFFQCYQMAYDLAKRAEACFRFELGLKDSNYIQFGYWDNLKKGLLSGEQLYLDLKRLEMAYLDQNKRELEITKYISLVLLDPLALITLKETGQCTVNLPEALFDMDYAGHYMRRIKSLSLTIPCVTGPYTGVNCTLTLFNNKTRVDNSASDVKDYMRDAHFVSDFAATQSVATSSAQNDSGLFEVNFHDERYLPFEGAGVISTWHILLPKDANAFDFESISDVILNLKYTARDGGAMLRDVARAAAVIPAPTTQPAPGTVPVEFPGQPNLVRYFSLKHEFPTDWYRFLHPVDQATSQTMVIALTIERFPYIYRGKKIQISQVELLLKFKDIYDPALFKLDPENPTPLGDYMKAGAAGALSLTVTPPGATGKGATLSSAPTLLNGVPHASVPQTLSPNPPSLGGLGTWTLGATQADIQKIAASLQNVVTSGGANYAHLNPDVIDDIFLVCHYSAT